MKSSSAPFWHPNRALGRLFLALCVGVVAALALAPAETHWTMRGLIAWDTGAIAFLVVAWKTLSRTSPAETKARAGAEDPGRRVVWLVTTLSSFASLFGAIAVFRAVRNLPGFTGQIWTAAALLAVVCSWLLTHTLYTFRYAHLYYRHAEPFGLEFAGPRKPADIDFAYFAFTIGMCFQVSDVVISCSFIRRAALGHALLSFVYNTTIVALGMNLAFSALGNGP
jgi:uncharacterized membrane protein